MSTIKEQVQRCVKSFRLTELMKDLAVLPPSVMVNARAIVFFRKLPRGKQSTTTSVGIFVKRLGKEEWSNPVAVSMAKGDVYWGKLPRVDRSDILLVISDVEVVHSFELYGQTGFSDETNKLKKGVLVENSDSGVTRFTEALSERPDMLRDDDNFSFGICDGRLFSVHIENPVLRVRDSSNTKFYTSRSASAASIFSNQAELTAERASLVGMMHDKLRAHFDVAARLPAYACLLEKDSEGENATGAGSGAETSDPVKRSWQQQQQLQLQQQQHQHDYGVNAMETRRMPSESMSSEHGAWAPSGSTASDRGQPLGLHGEDHFPLDESAPFGQLGQLDPSLVSRTASMSVSSRRSSVMSNMSLRSRGSSLGGWDSEGSAQGLALMGGSGTDLGSGRDLGATGYPDQQSSPWNSDAANLASTSSSSSSSSSAFGQSPKYSPKPPSDMPPNEVGSRERVNSFDFAV
ncbi:SH3 domain-containing protein PJ696.02 [Hondaea fermentalgiana]|uniref:SH3 domain-containing protein PJ696.02 n=1 Tax=Hondaea fermentalgiana TaxID=2315210 RepID=A0A2R5GH28_9STRA|nr:SH3 domain-containing protein PJ696.02 [Hondaea fermentalgiana]|eukprot:GBG29649.1 SH3 domain-containing protein PJ696.02 [Hondaea fermentalgiana]